MKSRRYLVLFLTVPLGLVLLLTAFPVSARPAAQDPYPPDDYPTADLGNYPGGEFPTADVYNPPETSATPPGAFASATPLPGQTQTLATATPSGAVSGTPQAGGTSGRDLFGTEDAEMGGARVTPPPSETPLPSPTNTNEPTPTPTETVSTAFSLNSGWFLTGILLPVFVFGVFWLVSRAQRSGEFR